MPEYFGAEQLEDGAKWKICLQNLLYGFEKGSFVDIKLGKSTLTENSGSFKTVRQNLTDKMTTANSYGFTICGMTIKNPENGSKIFNYGKIDSPKNLEEAQEYLENFFDKGNG